MFKQRSLVGRAGMALAVAATVLAAAIIVDGSMPASDDANKPRADIIRIDGLRQFGPLERPAVVFLHEKHTQALAKKKDGKDCAACHLSEKERLSPRYMRLKDVSKQAVMAVYHDNCTACHRQTASAGEKSGPVVCAECHRDKAPASSWREIGMDRSLHYRHVKAQENKCEACHHEYDAAGKKLFYAKGKEGTCRYCHEEKTVENRISFRLAAHLDCVNCHRQKLAKNQSAGPVTCSGCHDAGEQEKIEKVKDVPRMKRNQPDTVLVKAVRPDEPGPQAAERPGVVPFNHIGHESYSDNCRVCHHASLEACVTCHTSTGAKEGKFVKLSTAMHRAESKASCVGCHQAAQSAPSCAGCHAALPKQAQPQDLSGCASCHVPKPAAAANPAPEDKALAAQLLAARRPVTGTYPEADIPETVLIKAMSKQYEPVKLPHRKIVNALVGGIKDSKLAAYFHREPGTVCQSCHHHSPAAKKPPACASCHGQPFDPLTPDKPGLMAAYHLQCMECHQQMNLERPVATHCTACHKEKL